MSTFCFYLSLFVTINYRWLITRLTNISPIHTFVNIPALIRKRSVFLSSKAGILTKVWIRDMMLHGPCSYSVNYSIWIMLNTLFTCTDTITYIYTSGQSIKTKLFRNSWWRTIFIWFTEGWNRQGEKLTRFTGS